MFKQAIPVLHVSSSKASEEFYCQQLGFQLRSAYRFDDAMADPCYMTLSRDDALLHISSFPGDAIAGGVVYLIIDGLDSLHADLVAKGVAIELEPTDQTWDNREMYVKDLDGNTLRFTQQ